MPSSLNPTPKLPIVTDMPTPLEIAAHTITDFPSPSASSPAQYGDNSNSQSLSDDASATDSTDSPVETPPSQGKFLSSSSSIISASQNTSSISIAQRLALPRLPTHSQTPIPTNTQSSLSPLLVYHRRNTNPPTHMAPQTSLSYLRVRTRSFAASMSVSSYPCCHTIPK